MASTKSKKKNKIKKKWVIIFGIIALLIIFRLFLPGIVLHYANNSLARLDGYYGHIDDIDISLYRGAYQIDNIYLNKIDTVSGKKVPFFNADLIDLSVEWRALFDGRIVGKLIFLNPTLIFTKDKSEPKDVQKDTTNFKQVLKDLMPLKVNRFEVKGGSVHYKDENSKPKVDLKMESVYILAQNLSSVKDTALLPATVTASANVYKGTLTFDMKIDPLADDPTFDLNAELKNTSLPEFNEFFKAYAKLDVNKGTFGLYTEIAAKDRKFIGYVKPVINDLDVVGPEDRNDNLLRKLWENIAGTVGKLLENPKKDQLAAKIPIKGNFDKTTIGTWYAISTVLKNAFIQALYPSLDYQVTIANVEAQKPEKKKGFFEKIFNNKDDKKDSDKKK
ncbi:MAG: DUF748 domain-containing protein [Omnitrophica WOR_2 bacterium]